MASDDPHGDSEHEMPKYDYSATRRDFMLKLGIGINAIAGALVGIPIIGFFCVQRCAGENGHLGIAGID